MPVKTIVLVDDHRVVREGIRLLLESETDFRVVGETGDGLEAPELVALLQPDVLIVDIQIPGLNGLEITRRVHQRNPDTHIVVLSMYSNETYVQAALRNGALAYVLKEETPHVLVEAVRTVLCSKRYLCPSLRERAIQAYVEHASATGADDSYEALTTREREVLHLTAEGRTAAEIATRLSISPRTVETHRAHVMRKLGFHSQTELIRYALQKGLIAMEQDDIASIGERDT